MGQAENLLNSLAEEQETTSAQPINDFLIIDANGRITNVPSTEIILGVETDHNVERKYFKCPRIVGDNIDLTTLSLRVNFQNGNGDRDKYIIEDVTVDGDYITFSWLLSDKVLATKGNVLFTVQAVSVEDDGVVKNRWNTALASGNVLETLIVDDLYDYEEEQARDVLAQLLYIIDDSETNSKYFDIDHDGLVSLKIEYRGACDKNTDSYTYAISDRGVNKEGSLIDKLPEKLVIPEIINDIAVTGFQNAIFYCNERVKEIRIPSNIKTIPKLFCYKAKNFVKIENTENITSVGSAAFSLTKIKKAIFPNLQTLENSAFSKSPLLTIVDIGKVTSIPNNCFMGCNSLSALFGGDNVTNIDKYVFMNTYRLKNLSFISKLTNIGDCAFIGSRVSLENLSSDCVLSNNTPSYKQFGDSDYWSSCTYTPCENKLGSLFHQRNPEWVKETVMDLPNRTYATGCGTIVGAEIYSALTGVEFNSPKDFEAIIGAIDTNLLTKDMADSNNAKTIFEVLGYETELYTDLDSVKLQNIYDELKNGALLYKLNSTYNSIEQGGHVVVVYGVNDIGELLIADSDTALSEVDIYENFKYSMPIYKLGTEHCDVIIVKKP